MALERQVADADVSYSIPQVSAGVAFSDSFETGDLSNTQSGFRWAIPTNCSVTSDWPRTGTYSLKVAYPQENFNGYSWAEQRLIFPADSYTEIWWQWYLYLPDGTEGIGVRYEHTPNSQGASSNNKIGLLFSQDKHFGNTGSHATLGLEANQSGTDNSFTRGYYSGQKEDGTKSNVHPNCLAEDNLTLPRGEWIKMRYRGKLATWSNGVPNYDGEIDIWVNNNLVITGRNLGTIDCSVQGPVRYAPLQETMNFYEMCYFLGFANGGFTQQTNVYVDDVTIATTEADLP